jgi:two-component system, chemotaxis family, chemotaxis protein CheY
LFRSLDLLRDLVAQATPADTVADARIDPLEAALRQRAEGFGPVDSEQAAAIGGQGVPGDSPAPRSTVPPSATRREDAGTPRALLVDDSATVRLLESMVLQEAGYEVDAVADGSEALARALSRVYQLVVTSVETRGLRGVDLAAAVRALPTGRGVPIIVMSSGDDDAHERQRAAAVGVQAYIRKGSFGERRLLEAARELRPTGDG